MIEEPNRKDYLPQKQFTSTINLSLSMSAAVSVLSLQNMLESAMSIIEGSVASSFSSKRAKALRSGSGSLEDGGLGSSPDSDVDGRKTLKYAIKQSCKPGEPYICGQFLCRGSRGYQELIYTTEVLHLLTRSSSMSNLKSLYTS